MLKHGSKVKIFYAPYVWRLFGFKFIMEYDLVVIAPPCNDRYVFIDRCGKRLTAEFFYVGNKISSTGKVDAVRCLGNDNGFFC